VLRPFDGKNLNVENAAFEDVVPTTENLAREIYRRLAVKWTSVFPGPWPVLERVRIAETPRNIFEVKEYGET
jgi:6-pyruvoyl-tetrahydropterin synthase